MFEKKGDIFCSSERVAKSESNETPVERFPHIGNPDDYQKKGVSGEAKGIVVKTKGIGKVAQIWARGSGLSGDSGKSGVEQFEWSLITLVSVAWRLLLSQELFYQYSNELWKLVRTERKVKRKNPPFA